MSEGLHLIAGAWEPGRGTSFTSFDPRTGEASERRFQEASLDQVSRAVAGASGHASWNGFAPSSVRSQILTVLADAIDGDAERVIDTADRESALGRGRLEGELQRTSGQLRAFAHFLDSGDARDKTEDTIAGDVRLLRLKVALGPVAVFEASNFPLAFATLGGDTASALAAGCPVVVKAHPSHPETSEVIGRIAGAVFDEFGLQGAFSVLHGPSPELGLSLVEDSRIAAVGFTGSLQAGRALMDAASRRPVPIPVYAEMGSVNPLIVTAAAADERPDDIATGFVQSLLLGSGQFCTKPGLLMVPDSPGGRRLVYRAAEEVAAAGEQVVLNQRIQSQFLAGCESIRRTAATLAESESVAGGYRVGALLAEIEPPIDALEETFGPAGLVVRYGRTDHLLDLIRSLPGSLSAAVHAVDDDPHGPAILSAVCERVGRIVWNGYPTGVAVSPAMMHGGPYPASATARHTSVGLAAMSRFQRPLAFQGVPPALIGGE